MKELGDTVVNAVCNIALGYIDETLSLNVGPYIAAVVVGFLLVYDNTRLHVTRVYMQFLNDKGNDPTDWSSHSPDLNPIEHL